MHTSLAWEQVCYCHKFYLLDLALQVIDKCTEESEDSEECKNKEDSSYEFVDDFQCSWGPKPYRRDNHVLDIMVCVSGGTKYM